MSHRTHHHHLAHHHHTASPHLPFALHPSKLHPPSAYYRSPRARSPLAKAPPRKHRALHRRSPCLGRGFVGAYVYLMCMCFVLDLHTQDMQCVRVRRVQAIGRFRRFPNGQTTFTRCDNTLVAPAITITTTIITTINISILVVTFQCFHEGVLVHHRAATATDNKGVIATSEADIASRLHHTHSQTQTCMADIYKHNPAFDIQLNCNSTPNQNKSQAYHHNQPMC